MHRVTRPGGVVRITDAISLVSTSPMLNQILSEYGIPAAIRAGNAFEQPTFMIEHLIALLTRYRFEAIAQQTYPLAYVAGTSLHRLFVEDMTCMLRLAPDFWRKWIHVPENYDALYQHMVQEIEQPDFVANWPLFTVWGKRPARSKEEQQMLHRHED